MPLGPGVLAKLPRCLPHWVETYTKLDVHHVIFRQPFHTFLNQAHQFVHVRPFRWLDRQTSPYHLSDPLTRPQRLLGLAIRSRFLSFSLYCVPFPRPPPITTQNTDTQTSSGLFAPCFEWALPNQTRIHRAPETPNVDFGIYHAASLHIKQLWRPIWHRAVLRRRILDRKRQASTGDWCW